jgi:hypothetical protein
LTLTWPSPVTLSRVVLHDRPNSADQVMSGTLRFSDGSTVDVGTLPNDGTGLTVTFPARATQTLVFTVTSVSGSTGNVGLAEIEPWGVQGGTFDHPPMANAGPDQEVTAGASVQLDGSASQDPEGNPVTYSWTPSAQPTFTAPATPGTLRFALVVNDGAVNSTPDTVAITVITLEQNIAGTATATASSQEVSTGQTAAKAIDGVVDGYPGDYTREWATTQGRAGSWLTLTWSSPVTLSWVVLHDRPNSADQVLSGTLRFTDGSTVSVGTLPNDGSGLTVTFPARATETLTFTVTSVSGSTWSVGLAEIEAWGVPGGTVNHLPVAAAGADQSVDAGTPVQLDGTGSHDPDGSPLTYSWTQAAGPAVTLSSATAAQPTFTAPSVAGTLRFALVVNDGVLNSIPDTVAVTVVVHQPPVAVAGPDQAVPVGASVQLNGSGSYDPDGHPLTYSWTQTAGPAVTLSSTTSAQPTFTAPATPTSLAFALVVNDGTSASTPDTVVIDVLQNVARTATASASSESPGTQQTANKAIDGVIAGYPGDYTREWATNGGRAGSWLTLTWSSPVTLSRVVLYDRPNTADQITAATLRFSDGSTVNVGSLPNNGSAFTVTFAARSTTSLTLTVTTVSGSTLNVGLAEIQAFGN